MNDSKGEDNNLPRPLSYDNLIGSESRSPIFGYSKTVMISQESMVRVF
jgi:hypothetical protein